MDETTTGYHFSPDRLKLLWLLLRKRGIDFSPRQIYPPEYATSQVKNESEMESAKKNHQEDPVSDNKSPID